MIGSVGPLSGPASIFHAAASEALQVWVRDVNARGGVNGHRVELVRANDQADPARHRALVQELVERRHVVAFVQNFEVFGGEASTDYITQHRVPVIGSEGGYPYFYTNPMYFPQMATADALNRAWAEGAGEVLLSNGVTKAGLFTCLEATACQTGKRELTEFLTKAGFDVVYQVESSIAAPDYTAECLNARRAGVQVWFPIVTADAVRRLASACARQGFTPRFAIAVPSFHSDMVADPLFEGLYVFNMVFAWVDGTPKSREFVTAMSTYAPGRQSSGAHSQAWASAKLFERAAQSLSEPPSSASVLDGLWTIKNEDLGGLTQPLTFSRDQPAPKRSCWFTMTITGGKLLAVDGGTRHCVE